MNAIELNLFASRTVALCDEMGLVLQRAAFSPNIKDRLDFSCALFDASGDLLSQAAHIPVHLGSMAFAMRDVIASFDWQEGDIVFLNDPYLGGTHLPDVTLLSPVFCEFGGGEPGLHLMGFVANRAHHANIGCDTPGSMPVSSSLDEEGVVIAPTLLMREGAIQDAAYSLLRNIPGSLSQNEAGVEGLNGDFAAQTGANRLGIKGMKNLIEGMGRDVFAEAVSDLNEYARRMAVSALKNVPPGSYSFNDYLDDDGQGNYDIPLRVEVTVKAESASSDEPLVLVDLTGCAAAVGGNLNCPESVAAAAAYYAFRCLMPASTPACAGTFAPIELRTRAGTIVNAIRPAAVAAGNVETSMRLVDLVLGALAEALPQVIPAASQGTMNNIAMGYRKRTETTSASESGWDYYETLAGGMGAGPNHEGLSARHSHMTNTLNTPIESLEMHYPLRVLRYQLRHDSGGKGLHQGGCGVTREYQFLDAARFTILSERRRYSPWGLAGGGNGLPGSNSFNGSELPGKFTGEAKAGDRLTIFTPGGGGWGSG